MACKLQTQHALSGQELRKLRYVPANAAAKARAILTKVYAGAFYGIGANDLGCRNLDALSSAVMGVFRQKNDYHDSDLFYATALGTADLNPVVQLLTRRVLEFRRAICKRPKTLNKFRGILNLYAGSQRGEGAVWYHDQVANPGGQATSPRSSRTRQNNPTSRSGKWTLKQGGL